MKCAEYKRLFSPYLDGQVSGAEMHALQKHMQECNGCAREYAEVQRTLQLVVALNKAKRKAPADLPLKLRLAISRESKQARRRRFEGAVVRLSNALNAFMVPATAGVVSAVLTFGLLLGFFALPQQLIASSSDVPLMLYTGPQLKQSVFGTSLGSMGDDSVVIEAYVAPTAAWKTTASCRNRTTAKAVPPAGKEPADLHDLQPGTFHGRTDRWPRRNLVFEDQREGVKTAASDQ